MSVSQKSLTPRRYDATFTSESDVAAGAPWPERFFPPARRYFPSVKAPDAHHPCFAQSFGAGTVMAGHSVPPSIWKILPVTQPDAGDAR